MSNEWKPGLSVIEWHRLRKRVDDEIDRWSELDPSNPQLGDTSFATGWRAGNLNALSIFRAHLRTPEESEDAERVRREMFG